MEEGIDASKAKGFVDPGIGPRTVRTRVVGERFKRYSSAPGDKGSLLTEGADYPNAKAAKDALDLRNPPTVIQEVEIIRDVRAVESGIKGGAQDARQLIVPPDSYRIVSERPIRCPTRVHRRQQYFEARSRRSRDRSRLWTAGDARSSAASPIQA